MITPCLTFNKNAEAAVKFYTSVFKNAKKGKVSYYGDNSGMPKGTVLTIMFKIGKQEFLALNGGPTFKFTQGISLMVNCTTQKEVDYYWDKLSKGGKKIQCGWLQDKFGVSWQVVPIQMIDMLTSKNEEKLNRAIAQFMQKA